jgi:hypothetical protein
LIQIVRRAIQSDKKYTGAVPICSGVEADFRSSVGNHFFKRLYNL